MQKSSPSGLVGPQAWVGGAPPGGNIGHLLAINTPVTARKRSRRSAGKPTGTTSILKSRISTMPKTTDEGKERVDGQASPSTLNQVWSSVSTVASIPPSVNESA